MTMLRKLYILGLLTVLFAIGPTQVAAGMYGWETAVQNCITSGGDVTLNGQCGGGFEFYDCVENNFDDACWDYCTAGASGTLIGNPSVCECELCEAF